MSQQQQHSLSRLYYNNNNSSASRTWASHDTGTNTQNKNKKITLPLGNLSQHGYALNDAQYADEQYKKTKIFASVVQTFTAPLYSDMRFYMDGGIEQMDNCYRVNVVLQKPSTSAPTFVQYQQQQQQQFFRSRAQTVTGVEKRKPIPPLVIKDLLAHIHKNYKESTFSAEYDPSDPPVDIIPFNIYFDKVTSRVRPFRDFDGVGMRGRITACARGVRNAIGNVLPNYQKLYEMAPHTVYFVCIFVIVMLCLYGLRLTKPQKYEVFSLFDMFNPLLLRLMSVFSGLIGKK